MVGNLSTLIGLNDTWPDLDLVDLGADSPWHGVAAAALQQLQQLQRMQ